MADPRLSLRLWRRALLRHRRLLLALLAAATAVAFAQHLRPPAPPATSVLVAAHDLAAGTRIGPDDVRIAAFPDRLVPGGSMLRMRDVVGETVAGPMRAGEVVTDRQVVAGSLVDGYPAGTLAAPVRVADADVVALLEVGDRIDVYAAAPADRRSARLVVSDAHVLALPQPAEGRVAGGLVVLAVDRPAAAALASAGDGALISIVLRG
jgi:Flp pilus assembly protein CpaB